MDLLNPPFFERRAQEWRRLTDQIAEHQDSTHDYFQDGVRLLELSKKAYFLFEKQNPAEKRRLLDFVCSNSTWKDQTLTATFRQPFDLLAVTNTAWQRQKAAGGDSSDLRPIWLPAVDTLRNFFYAAIDDMKITFEGLQQDSELERCDNLSSGSSI